jgi:hypothetical protein
VSTNRDLLILTGNVGASPTAGYQRIYGKGLIAHYVEIKDADIVEGPSVTLANQATQIGVKIESRLALSDYPLESTIKKPVIRPPVEIPGLKHPAPSGFSSIEGNALTVKKNGSAVVGFSGTDADGHFYDLNVQTSKVSGPGRVANTVAAWLNASMTISVDGDKPISFGFSYCPTNNLMDVFLTRDTVQNSISIDLSGANNAAGSAKLVRFFSYYSNVYAQQSDPQPVSQTDPQLYLASEATLWPTIGRIGFFQPALQAIAAETAGAVTATKGTFLSALGSLTFNYPGPALADFIAETLPLVGPALGPYAASFVSPTEALVVGALKPAALWLGAFLLNGPGKVDLVAEMTNFYNFMKQNAGKFAPNFQPDATPLPIERDSNGQPIKPDPKKA